MPASSATANAVRRTAPRCPRLPSCRDRATGSKAFRRPAGSLRTRGPRPADGGSRPAAKHPRSGPERPVGGRAWWRCPRRLKRGGLGVEAFAGRRRGVVRRTALVCLEHPAVRAVDRLARLEGDRGSTARQPEADLAARCAVRIDPDASRRRRSRAGHHAVDPQDAVGAAAKHGPVDPRRRCALPEPGSGQGIDRGGNRLRRLSEVGVIAEPVELEPLLRARKEPAETFLRVQAGHRREDQQDASDRTGRCSRAPRTAKGCPQGREARSVGAGRRSHGLLHTRSSIRAHTRLLRGRTAIPPGVGSPTWGEACRWARSGLFHANGCRRGRVRRRDRARRGPPKNAGRLTSAPPPGRA